jgi:hypothetical protein
MGVKLTSNMLCSAGLLASPVKSIYLVKESQKTPVKSAPVLLDLDLLGRTPSAPRRLPGDTDSHVPAKSHSSEDGINSAQREPSRATRTSRLSGE